MLSCIDSHCHLQFEQYDRDREEVVRRCFENRVGALVVGVDYATSAAAVELAREYQNIWATVGLHPHYVVNGDWQGQLPLLEDLAQDENVVAIGEIGFDRSRLADERAMAAQAEVFERMVSMAAEVNKPLIIHVRYALADLKAALERLGQKIAGVGGVVHCYPGDGLLAHFLFAYNFKLGFTGLVTYNPTWDRLLSELPLDKILIETDAPYLTPTPYCHQRNEPIRVIEVARHIAGLKNIPLEAVLDATFKNTQELFRI